MDAGRWNYGWSDSTLIRLVRTPAGRFEPVFLLKAQSLDTQT
jgi:hypothetical protein